MKLGITADLHLTTKNKHPERFNAFVDILDQCVSLGAEQLILAGDSFDQTLQNFALFEGICKQEKYKGIQIHLIPGNHDPNLAPEKIIAANVAVYPKPTWIDLPDGWQVLFLPFSPNTSMGETIQEHFGGKRTGKWILVGHGDWSQGIRKPNPLEPGVYMPLTRKDIAAYTPDYVFLGHIHIPQDLGTLYYPGSPCGLDITETGYRRFLILDTETTEVTSHPVDTDILFFKESLIVLPTDDEARFVKEKIGRCIESWGLDEKDRKKVRLKVDFHGYSSNRKSLQKVIKDGFREYEYYQEPDLSAVSTANDPDRNYLMEKFLEQIESLEWRSSSDEPDKDAIILKAMHMVYGED